MAPHEFAAAPRATSPLVVSFLPVLRTVVGAQKKNSVVVASSGWDPLHMGWAWNKELEE